MPPENRYKVHLAGVDDLDEGTVASWDDLGERALERNAYLSPQFVLPAVRRLLTPRQARGLLFVFVEDAEGGGSRLAGAGVFSRSRGTSRFPLPHLRAFLSPHSYLSGLLVDREDAEGAIRAFFRFFCSPAASWHGVEFASRISEGPQAERIASAAEEFDAAWQETERSRRAVFVPSEGGEAYLRERLPHGLQKELRRQRRRMEEMGEVRWKALLGAEADRGSEDRFLALEHAGWKAVEGTSLRSDPSHELFFREAAEGFRKKGRLFFTELSVGGSAIASTSNFISGGAGFAFKIGWSPEFAKMSPGMLNEVECIRNAPELFRGLSFIDSGAEEGSFIDRLWAGRRELSSGVFGTTAIGRAVLSGIGCARRVKRRLAGNAPA